MNVTHETVVRISSSIVDGKAKVRMVRYGRHVDDGWWLLAEEHLPGPPPDEEVTYACLHCLLELLDPHVGAGMDAAKRDADEFDDDAGFAAWHQGGWVTGADALDAVHGSE